MASVFQRGRSDVWIAAFRAWDAAGGRWRWCQKSTGTTDKARAMGIAATLERASGDAKAGVMTREKAMKLVNDVLALAGCVTLEACPTLSQVAEAMLSGADVAEATARKYRAQWKALKEWAGAKAMRPVDSWTVGDVTDYYAASREAHSDTTANDHLRFVGMLFDRAVKLGHRTTNPVSMVDKVSNDTVARDTFTRSHLAALLRTLRRSKRLDWSALVLLGWHTGHRIQDLLDLTPADVAGDLVTIKPRKKGKAGREVVLPLPRFVARLLVRIGGFGSIHAADNRSGHVSADFVTWLKASGIDPLPTKRGTRTTHRRSFHSFRHSMATRLISAGISGELARLVTDHDSPQVQRRYVHAEIEALRVAMAAARRK
jgi:site-specific recombinase XerD